MARPRSGSRYARSRRFTRTRRLAIPGLPLGEFRAGIGLVIGFEFGLGLDQRAADLLRNAVQPAEMVADLDRVGRQIRRPPPSGLHRDTDREQLLDDVVVQLLILGGATAKSGARAAFAALVVQR